MRPALLHDQGNGIADQRRRAGYGDPRLFDPLLGGRGALLRIRKKIHRPRDRQQEDRGGAEARNLRMLLRRDDGALVTGDADEMAVAVLPRPRDENGAGMLPGNPSCNFARNVTRSGAFFSFRHADDQQVELAELRLVENSGRDGWGDQEPQHDRAALRAGIDDCVVAERIALHVDMGEL
ncbi:MAG: hypothetical protein OXF57_10090, partial [Rhodospirillaceae bacterium]|nr:hypothetical protein [Rhodospirillaceae bacterium]